MTRREAKKFLENNTGYIKWGAGKLADKLGVSYKVVKNIKKELKKEEPVERITTVNGVEGITPTYQEFLDFIEVKKNKEAGHKPSARKLPKPFEGGDSNNVLVIGDLHEPFCLEDYLTFCREQQEKFNCGKVIFIGDVIDNHASSYHESSTEASGADTELDHAIRKIQDWYKVFPVATVLIGNHDRMAYRKAQTGGVAKKWVRNYDEVLGTPGWIFTEEVIIDNVCYNHGEGGTARKKMKDESMSMVQGHLHSQAYVEWSVGSKFRIFGLQVGCGVDRRSYAMSYGKNFKKPVVSCGVVLNKGTLPILIPMDI